MSDADHKDAIRELLAEYCFLLDGHQFAEFSRLFTADGDWLSRNGNASGPAAIEQLLSAMLPPEAQRKHFTSNIVIKLDGAQATVRSNFMAVRQSPAGPAIAVAGTYEDEVVLLEGRWLFKSRRLFHDIAGESGLNTVAKK
ncbi:MAG TPA: nuclear transport factor 2 family protein [Burkholderiales bacterium]